jgi:Histidine kinase-, DNA gyrase B-, and HSP90-like ATPase
VATATEQREFRLTVLGRTLEHLGVQMYKRRDTAIAELVANCWDAGATEADVRVPEPAHYDISTSEITICDNGEGMSPDDVEHDYLVVGRNRRVDGSESHGRPVMGRKGIGKLAGFGVAARMNVTTWQKDVKTTSLTLDVAELKREPGAADTAVIAGEVRDGAPPWATTASGTLITLTGLKHKTAIDIAQLREALGRRFSRTVRGVMTIRVNGEEIPEPSFDLDIRVPAGDGMQEATLGDGNVVRYWYGFTEKPIHSRLLRGFTILVRGKTAQAPPWFFEVEGTASGQHGTKYMTGTIEADFLDEGDDDESDLISTDRQEIDWEDEATQALREWGEQVTREALRERASRRGDQIEKLVADKPEFKSRIDRLEPATQKQLRQYLRTLGEADAEEEKNLELADSLIRAFEYQHFHTVIRDIESASASPDELQTLIEHIREWKVLESRAILEIVKGRLEIVDKFGEMIREDAPETASKVGGDNLHDLLADYPWLIHPEWQVLAEEKGVTTTLRGWGARDIPEGDRSRYDFLALEGDKGLVIVEIKRAGYAVEVEDLQRLERYKVMLERERRPIRMVLMSGGHFNFDESSWRKRPDIDLVRWSDAHSRARDYYEHYRAVLEGEAEHRDFHEAQREVQRTREVLETSSYRGAELRRAGLGPQSASHEGFEERPEASDS